MFLSSPLSICAIWAHRRNTLSSKYLPALFLMKFHITPTAVVSVQFNYLHVKFASNNFWFIFARQYWHKLQTAAANNFAQTSEEDLTDNVTFYAQRFQIRKPGMVQVNITIRILKQSCVTCVSLKPESIVCYQSGSLLLSLQVWWSDVMWRRWREDAEVPVF